MIKETTVLTLMSTATASFKVARADIQAALLGLVEHADVTGDKRLIMTKAVDWINDFEGANRTAMVEFLVKFGGVKLGEGGFANDQGVKADYKGALGCQWWTLKPDAPFKGVDLLALMKKAVKEVHTKTEAAKDTGMEDLIEAPDVLMVGLAKLIKQGEILKAREALNKMEEEAA